MVFFKKKITLGARRIRSNNFEIWKAHPPFLGLFRMWAAEVEYMIVKTERQKI